MYDYAGRSQPIEYDALCYQVKERLAGRNYIVTKAMLFNHVGQLRKPCSIEKLEQMAAVLNDAGFGFDVDTE